MTKIYHDQDVDLELLRDKTIGVIGYGNQGQAQALNMRDSGLDVIVGNRPDEYRRQAEEDGFCVLDIRQAVDRSDIVFLLLPDEVAPGIYRNEVAPGLEEGNVLNFASGYNITFGHIEPTGGLDVILVAPRMIGQGVRELYEKEKGFPSFVAVEQDASGNAFDIALALAKGIGGTQKGAIEVTFDDETYLDLMAEHVTWPLVLAIFNEVFKFQVEKGHPEEAVLMELLLSKEPVEIFEKAADIGLFGQLPLHSRTSQYGQLTRFQEIDSNLIRDFIKRQYSRIASGEFAQEWDKEQNNGLPVFKRLLEEVENSEFSRAEERVKRRL